MKRTPTIVIIRHKGFVDKKTFPSKYQAYLFVKRYKSNCPNVDVKISGSNKPKED